MNEIVIIALAGFTTGITTVLFGFGGGFVVVPFVYQLMLRQPAIADNAMHVAVATSTAVMIFNAGWVSYRNWRAGRLAAQTLFPLLWFIAIGAVVGSCLAGILSENIVRALFILYMLATISDCLLRKGFFTGSARRRLSLPVGHRRRCDYRYDRRIAGRGRQRHDGAPATATRVCNAGVR
ncbi:integral membrane protein [Klebsiella pneumoniae]|uniref:Probable membrane transporter protein n=1 Tax=Klebsiella pneumoniae TaxID=573 RepID=A0A377ZWP8_KLEPN|nr:integral membrane protein [Klebsiella pneumoniae]